MKRPFDQLSAHGCAIYAGEKQVATTDPKDLTGARGRGLSHEDVEYAKMFAASPQAFEALFWILRSCRMGSPVGTTAYLISDETMEKAKGAMLLSGLDWETKPVMKCTRCDGSGSCLDERTIGRGLCPNCNGRGER